MFVKSAKGIDSLPPIPIFLVPISLKPDGVKEGIKKSEFVTMTQFLYEKPRRSSKPQRISKSMKISKVWEVLMNCNVNYYWNWWTVLKTLKYGQ